MKYLLLMRWALQMTIQVAHSSKSAAAKVALVCMAILDVFTRPGLVVTFYEVIRDDTGSTALSQGLEDALTVDATCV